MKRMHSLIYISLVLIMMFGCKNMKTDASTNENISEKQIVMSQEIKIDSITYVATTRGFYEKVIIKPNQIVVTNDRSEENVKTIEIDPEHFDKISESILELGLDNLETFVAPSEKHQTDAAAIAQIEVYVQEAVYSTQRFDHKNPPNQLAEITDAIYGLRDRIGKQ